MNDGLPKPRVCVVNYLNTVPLVWGLVHGPQRAACELKFCLPSKCAELLAEGGAEIGIVSSIEVPRQNLKYVPGLGIASNGPVRSILLASKKTLSEVRTLAADTSSRTSVVLAQIILALRYGARPKVVPHAPELSEMLGVADAALIIGDPALHIDPSASEHQLSDLGKEWTDYTGLPMVYAVWAGPGSVINAETELLLKGSYIHGQEHLDEIIDQEAIPRGFDAHLARRYLTHHIRFKLDDQFERGMQLFFRFAKELELL